MFQPCSKKARLTRGASASASASASDVFPPDPGATKDDESSDNEVEMFKEKAATFYHQWIWEVLKHGTNEQVKEACMSFFPTDKKLFRKLAQQVHFKKCEEYVRDFNIKTPFKWHAKWNETKRDPVTDNPKIFHWIKLRGVLAHLYIYHLGSWCEM